jgi:glycosyltransferase involved in cell wall biosynthesis
MSLVAIETHPIQYHAPVYRVIQNHFGIKVTAIYGSDFSVMGYRDPEFETIFRWDTDLLSGYESVFLSQVNQGGARTAEEATTRGLKYALRRLNPKAVLIVGYSPLFYLAAFLTALRLDYPLLFRGETTDHTGQRGMFKNFIRDKFLHCFYHRFDALLYVGWNSLHHFRRLGVPDEKLFFAPYCVDTAPFTLLNEEHIHLRFVTRKKLEISEKDIVLLFSGKIAMHKQPDLLLRAMKLLGGSSEQRMIALYVGEGRMSRTLKNLAKENPRVQIRLVGFQNQKVISRYYCASDLLVLPSSSETWGLVVNEALHHGLPCVVSDRVGCAPDLIEPGLTGEIFEAGNERSLAAAIERALPLIRRPEIREVCRKKVSNYTVERAAEGIAQAFWSVTQRTAERKNG